MSADEYVDCPKCNSKNSVAMYFVWEFTLSPDGKITHNAKGKCEKCGLEFK